MEIWKNIVQKEKVQTIYLIYIYLQKLNNMSNCVYTLFGRHFGSELELDNFLYNNKDFINLDNISDIVFSLMSVK